MQAYGTYPQPATSRGLSSLGTFSLWFGMALVGMTALYNAFGSTSATECLWGVLHIMRAMFAALLLGSFLQMRVRRQEDGAGAFTPMAINLFTLTVIFLVPFNNLWQEAKFDLQQDGFITVAEWVESGVIYPDSSGWAVLPERYRQLTADGRIQIDRSGGVSQVLFITQNGLIGRHAILYRSDSGAPSLYSFNHSWSRIGREAPHWYSLDS